MKNINRKLHKTVSLILIILAFFVITAFQSSAAMSESEMKSRLSSYSSWFVSPEKGVFTVVCPTRNISDDSVFTYVNKITSLLRGTLEDDYCEINIKFRYSESRYSSFDAFTETAFTLEDKLKTFWTNWSETNQMDVVCNYSSSSSGVVYSTNIMLKLNGSDPDSNMSEYDEKLLQIVNKAKSVCSTKMELVQYYCKWLDTNVKYSLFYQYTNSPYVALMYGKGVCGSYANALKDMCELSGIPAIVPVNQYELNHAWNEVYVGGKWYTVDLCYVVEPADGKYNGFCFANPDRKKFPVDHFSYIEKHKAEYVACYENSMMASVSDCTVPSVSAMTYTGSALKPTVTVKYGSTVLKKNVHYTVSYSSNVNVGQGKITIKGIPSGGYKGTKVVYFNIVPYNPTKYKATSQENYIKLSWSAVPGATGYRVYIYSSKTKSYSIAKDFTQSTSFTMKNLSAGTKYKFAVKAYAHIGGKVRWANGHSAYTAATQPFKAKVKAAYTSNSITLSWNKVSGASGYRVFRYNPSTKKWTKLVTTTNNTYTVKKLTAGTKYTFAVRPYVKVGSAVYWGDYNKYIFSTKLSAPETLSLSSPSKGKLNIKWSAVKGADGYQIYYKYNKSDNYKKLTNASSSPYLASLKSSSACYIKVRAYSKVSGGYVYSSFSSVKNVKVK